jgi:hypothetical protein
MKSPFPGMDPYLQQHWRDVHASLIIYARDQLQPALPRDLVARVEERVYLETEEDLDRSFYPDVRVVERTKRKGAVVAAGKEVEVAEPLIVKFQDEPITEPFIEIRDARTGNRVVSFIEFISPTNKVRGNGYDLYRQKQKEAERAGVSLVEIDLVLGGRRVLSVPLGRIRFRDRTRYQAVVRRGWKWNEAEVYALPLSKKLPAIAVPLRKKDADLRLDLQALLDRAYENGGYDTIDYQEDSDPPLEGSDAEWADALLRSSGKRK